jgi:Cd2+/Zn2+-exporting ATPase
MKTNPEELTATPRPAALKQLWPRLKAQSWEAIFTAITLIAMLLAWLTEYLHAPATAVAALYILAYITGGAFGLKSSLQSLHGGTMDIDLLMILAALGAAAIGSPFEGVLLLFLFSLSNLLQAYAMDRTRNAIRALMKLRPNQALIRRGSRLVTLPVEQVVIGDRFVMRPGDRLPLDGVVVAGESAVDEAPLTGESLPVAKGPGDSVLAGTINKNGSLEAHVTKLAKDSTLARLIQLVEEAQSQKAHTQRFLDRAEQYYTAGVIGLTALVALLPVVGFGEPFAPAFYQAMTVLVAASPCALIISTPAAILSAIGNGARRGILFKGGVYVEQAAAIKVIAFDKTGTLTEGKPQVTDVTIIAAGRPVAGRWQGSTEELLALAAAIELKSEHALARATVEAAQGRNLELPDSFAFQAVTGRGVQGTVNGLEIRVGSLHYFEAGAAEAKRSAEWEAATVEVERRQSEGKTAVAVAQMGGDETYILGVIAFADRLRPNAAHVVRTLKAQGIERVVMLTGDNERVARTIATQTGVDAYYAGLLPEDKVRQVKELEQQYGRVAMVGDGVNDAPALAGASLGIAMGAAGTDVALETANIILMGDELGNIPYVIDLSRQTRRTLVINLAFATLMIGLMIIAIFTANLSLPLAVVGHEGGTVLVSLNGLRLLLHKRRE